MSTLKNALLKIKPILYYVKGRSFLNHPHYIEGRRKDSEEMSKRPIRTEIINYLLGQFSKSDTYYLEIGVRNPKDNFDQINAAHKYSVDPGLEYDENPVDFKMTSNTFFNKLGKGEVLNIDIKFDLIFIDGLHLAQQVDADIENAFKHLKDSGFVILHDCNPPTEWHTRNEYSYRHTPSFFNWNGTTWKAFVKWRTKKSIQSCCIDTDFGVGVLSKTKQIGKPLNKNIEFYDYKQLEENRVEYLNLIDFETFKSLF